MSSRTGNAPNIEVTKRMAEKFYYEDNIFYLNELIKHLKNATKLDLDPALFSDKVIEDALFVQTTLSNLHRALIDNPRLIRRSEYLRRLRRTQDEYSEFLESVMSGSVTFAQELEPFFAKFREYRNELEGFGSEIRTVLNKAQDGVVEKKDIVSQEEFKFLLAEDRSSSEPA